MINGSFYSISVELSISGAENPSSGEVISTGCVAKIEKKEKEDKKPTKKVNYRSTGLLFRRSDNADHARVYKSSKMILGNSS